MEPEEAVTPDGPLYRIGWPPDPFLWPDRKYVGGNRFDDPDGGFRVLYVAEQRLACFVELLANYRPDPRLMATLAGVHPGDPEDPQPSAGLIAPGFFTRPMGSIRLNPGQRWLDLRSLPTRVALRNLMSEELDRLGYDRIDMDMSDVLSRDRKLTKEIGRWAYDQGYRGIAYKSRYHDEFDCWALFEGAEFVPMSDPPEPVSKSDPDLAEVANLFGLIFP